MPTGLPDPQLAAARRIAKSSTWLLRVRIVDGGTAVETVAVRGGRVRHDRIDRGGVVLPIETLELRRRWLVGNVVAAPGLMLFAAPFWAPRLHLVAPWWLIPFFAGVALMAIGYNIEARPVRRLRERFGVAEGWTELKALSYLKKPRELAYLSVPQLLRVEELAVYEVAAVRASDAGDGGIEVVARERELVERYIVDQCGRVSFVDSARLPASRLGWYAAVQSTASRLYGGDWQKFEIQSAD
jgi:hypothetical protein